MYLHCPTSVCEWLSDSRSEGSAKRGYLVVNFLWETSSRERLGCQPFSQISRNWYVSSFRPLVLLVRVLVRKKTNKAHWLKDAKSGLQKYLEGILCLCYFTHHKLHIAVIQSNLKIRCDRPATERVYFCAVRYQLYIIFPFFPLTVS
jgi:hypothetical protein